MAAKTSSEEVPFHELGFAEFVEVVKPSASLNRLPQLPGMDDVLTYQVYMNGEAAKRLDPGVSEQSIPGELLHTMTERLGLSPQAFRDNLLVAEIVALRGAWRNAVSLSARGNGWEERPMVSQKVLDDWALLDKDIRSHPWVSERLEAHRAGLQRLEMALKIAETVTGEAVVDLAPEAVNVGKILMQNSDYTAQAVAKDGEKNAVVMHENKRLTGLPRVGDEVTITFYRGQGQVFTKSPDLELSDPYLHQERDALAINVVDTVRHKAQVLLFAGVADFAKFARVHDLDSIVVSQAIDALRPKLDRMKEKPLREPIGEPFIDDTTGAIALLYVERGARHTALFDTKERLLSSAGDFGMTVEDARLRNLGALKQPEISAPGPNALVAQMQESKEVLRKEVLGRSEEFKVCVEPNLVDGRYTGPVVADSKFHIAQDIGRGQAVLHAKFNLDKLPEKGRMLNVQYKENRGVVSQRSLSHGHTR